jgi:galactonate dehydratase
LPVIKNGMVQAPFGRGLCTALRPEVKLRDDATIRISGASPRS